MAERLVNFVDFCWEKRAALQGGEVREGGIFQEEGSQFFPGGLGLDKGEVTSGEFSAAHC